MQPVAAGSSHNLALRADGTVVAWGSNSSGQTDVPAALAPPAGGVVAVAVGGYHSLALRADGTVVGWGRNDDGQTTIPGSATNVVAIAAGHEHSLALRADDTGWCWGLNGTGQRGNVTSDYSAIPVQVTGLSEVVPLC